MSNQRPTTTSATASDKFNHPVGKAEKRKPEKPVKVPAGGEIRITKNGVKYIYLPPAIYGEPVRRF